MSPTLPDWVLQQSPCITNSSVLEVTAVSDLVFDNTSSNIQNSLGYTRIVTYQEFINGVGPGTIQFANVTLQSFGALGESSALGMDVTILINNSGQTVSYAISNGTFTINTPDTITGIVTNETGSPIAEVMVILTDTHSTMPRPQVMEDTS